MTISIEDFFKLREALPILDVRSEGEFETGHIRNAVNIPLLTNEERILVGTDYKQRGQLEAIKTGFRLVGPRLEQIINQTLEIAANREAIVHCWRGGMRSSNFCQFVGMAGVKTHQLRGGYKAYRQAALEAFKIPFKFIVIGGFTGSGKTEVLRALSKAGEQIIDLEFLARHKGSSFGGLMQPPQPTSEQFENDLFEVIQTLDVNRTIWIEDESIAVGKVFLPQSFWTALRTSPVIELKVEKEIRVRRLVNEYGNADKAAFLEAMQRITKRLGGQHFNAAKEKLHEGDMAATIDILLTYYDKAYVNGLVKKKDRIKDTVTWDGVATHQLVAELKRKTQE